MSVRVAVGDPQPVDVEFPTPADAGVTVDITREDGTPVAMGQPATPVTGGVYRFMLSSVHVAAVDILTLTFTGTFSGVQRTRTARADICGGHYFEIPELRALPNLGDTTKYPDALLVASRVYAEDLIDRNCGTSFVARYRRDVLSGDGTHQLALSSRWVLGLLSVKVDGLALAPDVVASFELDGGRWVHGSDLHPLWPYGHHNVEVRYAAGWSPEPPSDLREACRDLARHDALTDKGAGVGPQALSLDTQIGAVRLAVAGLNYPTGVPPIDAVIAGYAAQTATPV